MKTSEETPCSTVYWRQGQDQGSGPSGQENPVAGNSAANSPSPGFPWPGGLEMGCAPNHQSRPNCRSATECCPNKVAVRHTHALSLVQKRGRRPLRLRVASLIAAPRIYLTM